MQKMICGFGLLIMIIFGSLQAQNKEKIQPTLESVKKIDQCENENEREVLVILTIGKITRADSLFGYNFEIKYDPSKIKFQYVSTIGTLSEFFEIKQFTVLEADSAIYGVAGNLNPFLSPVEGDLPLLAIMGLWKGQCGDTTDVKLSYLEYTEEFKKENDEFKNARLWSEIADKLDRIFVANFKGDKINFDKNDTKDVLLSLISNNNKSKKVKMGLKISSESFKITNVSSLSDNVKVNTDYYENNAIVVAEATKGYFDDTLKITLENNSTIGKTEGQLVINEIYSDECDCIRYYATNTLSIISDIPDTTTSVKEMYDHLNASYDEFFDCFKIETNDNYMKDIKIYDLSGKIIMTKQTENKSIRIETDKISRGLYILEIDSNNKKIIKSLIKY